MSYCITLDFSGFHEAKRNESSLQGLARRRADYLRRAAGFILDLGFDDESL